MPALGQFYGFRRATLRISQQRLRKRGLAESSNEVSSPAASVRGDGVLGAGTRGGSKKSSLFNARLRERFFRRVLCRRSCVSDRTVRICAKLASRMGMRQAMRELVAGRRSNGSAFRDGNGVSETIRKRATLCKLLRRSVAAFADRWFFSGMKGSKRHMACVQKLGPARAERGGLTARISQRARRTGTNCWQAKHRAFVSLQTPLILSTIHGTNTETSAENGGITSSAHGPRRILTFLMDRPRGVKPSGLPRSRWDADP